jgi:hypothetical protein
MKTTKPCKKRQSKGAAMAKTFENTRELSIEKALAWAFGVEYASLDFDDLAQADARPGTSTIWRLMQQGQLGCKIDGGGRSRAADDAEVIANAVADLPVALGGRPMAVEIASLSRAGLAPNWLPERAAVCKPRAWKQPNQFGTLAKTARVKWELASDATGTARSKQFIDVLACPVCFYPTAQQVAVSHRRYLDWYGCLLHLRAELRSQCLLTTIVLTDAMPPLKPWRLTEKKNHKAA